MKTLEELSSTESTFDILTILANIQNRYGLSSIAYFSQSMLGAPSLNRELIVTYSKEWVSHYNDMDYWRIDPVLNEGLRGIIPVDWIVFDHTKPDLKRFFGEAAEFGIGRYGISIPVRGLNGDRALLSISLNAKPSLWPQTSAFLKRDFQLLSYYLHKSISRKRNERVEHIKLAPREVECLSWAARGKTAEEIGIILSLSPKTVRSYQEHARIKLDAVNVTQAVFKAYALELLI